jgi:Carboxypeptidase regulatory-like domain
MGERGMQNKASEKWVGFLAGILLAMFVLPAMMDPTGVAFGYEEIPVNNGGSITGKVALNGPVPPPRLFHLVLYPFGPFCQKPSDEKGNRALQEFAVSKDGGLQDVVVAVQAVKKGKPFQTPKGEFHSVVCTFYPFVSVVQNHQKIKVINDDPVIHNIQVYQSEKGNIILNEPLPVKATQDGVLNFEANLKISQMICGMHEFMQAWTYVVDNPYYAITREDGTFSIDGLPPGTYTVTAWHPHMKIASQKIRVPARGVASLKFEFQASEVERPEYEQQEEGRIGHKARIRKDNTSGDAGESEEHTINER